MAFIYDLTDTWNNAGTSFNGIKLNATDTASAAGSKLLDLQINGASKLAVGKTGTVTATGIIESTVGGFKFPDATTQTTKATVNSVSGTGSVNGITLTGSVTNSGSLTLGGTLGNIANNQLTNSAITINGTSTALGGSIAVGTVTSVGGTGTVSGLSLTGSVTTSGSLTLGGTLVLTSGQVTDGLGFTPYNATNPSNYLSSVSLTSNVTGTLPIANGGTGATTDSGARTALGLGTAAVLNSGVAGGVATLDGSGTVPTSQLPGAVLGGLNYQGTWNASTNVPTLASSVGSKGYYYVVSTAGSTNLNGITDWKIGDWAVYDGSTWQKVDNTDAVSSVNGFTGAVVLTTTDVAQGTNLYFTQAAARGSVSAGTGISYNSTSGVITNSAPDQTVALTGAGTTVVTGTYPNFTITSNDSIVGTVTSVAASGGTTGLSFTGSPITTAGTLTLGGTLAIANGGTGATDAVTARANLAAAASGANTDITSLTGLTGGISTPDYIDFDTAAIVTPAVARMTWNDGDGTLDLGLKGGNVTLQVGQEEVQRSFNEAGVGIVEGNVVYVSGAQGSRIAVRVAQANVASTSTGTIGMATENIANGVEGYITTQGLVRKLNTILDSEGNALVEGDLLYLSATVMGGYTKIEPPEPNYSVFVGYVVRVHASVGSIFIRPNVYPSIGEINKVSIVSTASGNTLIYDAVAGYYKTGTLTAGTNVSISNGPGTITINATDQFTGTVTSVGGTGTVSGLTLTGTVTTSGNLTLGGTLAVTPSNFASQTANTVLAAPNGAAGVPSFRAIVAADIPTLNQNTTGTASNVTGTVAVANGGTGATTLTSGYLLKGNGTSAVSASVVYDDGTNVGIGTSSPGAKLDVLVADGAEATKLRGATGRTRIRPYVDATNGSFIDAVNTAENAYIPMSLAGSSIRLTTNGGLAATIDASGNVGIGTASPIAKLDVAGQGVFQGSTFPTYRGVNIGAVNINNNTVDGTVDFTQGLVFTANANDSGAWANAGIVSTGSAGFRGNLVFGTDDDGTKTNAITERMRITSSGNVGIGTSSPTAGYKLDVSGSANASGSFVSGGGTTSQAAIGNKTLEFYNTGAGDGLIKSSDDSSSFTSIALNKTQVKLFTSNTERMRIDASGNVGIGTSSPAGKLHTVSTSAFTAPNLLCTDNVSNFRIVFNTGAYAGVPANKPWLHSYDDIYVGSDANTAFNVMSGGVNTLKVTSVGNVGIGTSSPAYRLDVTSAGTSALRISGPGNVLSDITDGTITLRQQIGGEGAFGTVGAHPLALRTNNTEAMRIDASGNVGIGTSSPGTKLDVLGAGNPTITLRGSDGAYTSILNLQAAGGGASTINATGGSNALVLQTNSSERMRIDSSGNLLVGTTALPSGSGTSGVGIRNVSGVIGQIIIGKTQSGTVDAQTFYYSGTYVGGIQISDTTTSLITSSDVRLKDNITDADDAANLIDAIQVRRFDWKADGSHQRYGFVAQELVTVAPEAVSQPEDPEEMMGVDYSKLVPMLVKEIQSLRARVAQLEGN